jgi:hypothetical protein
MMPQWRQAGLPMFMRWMKKSYAESEGDNEGRKITHLYAKATKG